MAKANPMVPAAEALIVKGKEQGFLSPDDILAGFPDVKVDPDQLFRIFNVVRDMGIEVSGAKKDLEEVAEIDDGLIATIQAMGSVSLGEPVQMYPKKIERVAKAKADQDWVVSLAKEKMNAAQRRLKALVAEMRVARKL